MNKNYAYIGEYNNGYAFVKSYKTYNNKGIIDENGNEIIPAEYHEIVGNINDDILIGVKKINSEGYSTVDWDNETARKITYDEGNRFYLLDKKGHKYQLNIDSRCDVDTAGSYGDEGYHYKFTYTTNWYSNHYDIYKHYAFYYNNKFILISGHGSNYIQYFSGETKQLDYSEFEKLRSSLRQQKIKKKK